MLVEQKITIDPEKLLYTILAKYVVAIDKLTDSPHFKGTIKHLSKPFIRDIKFYTNNIYKLYYDNKPKEFEDLVSFIEESEVGYNSKIHSISSANTILNSITIDLSKFTKEHNIDIFCFCTQPLLVITNKYISAPCWKSFEINTIHLKKINYLSSQIYTS